MDGSARVLALAALPTAGNFLGGLVAEAAGIVLAVVGLELMPRAMDTAAPWVPITAFVGGGLFFMAIEPQHRVS